MSEISSPLIVRGGENVSLGYDKEGNPLHTRLNVMRVMILEICRAYAGLPDYRTLELDDIEFFYDGIRGELIQRSKSA